VSSGDEICRRLDQLDAVIIQPSSVAQPMSVALFRFCRGEWAGPQAFVLESEDAGQTLEARLRITLEQLAPAGAKSASQFAEELAILKRWYYRSHKVGEMVLAKADGGWPVRKLVNAIMRAGKGERQLESPPAPSNLSVDDASG
jgi:hypothetical protein